MYLYTIIYCKLNIYGTKLNVWHKLVVVNFIILNK